MDESITLLEDGMTPAGKAASMSISASGGGNGETSGDASTPSTVNSDADVDSKSKGCFTNACCVHPLLVLVQFIFSGYHVLTSSALKTKGVDPLVFALYRELSASALMAMCASMAVWKGKHNWHLKKEHVPRFLAMGLFSAGNVLGAVQSLTLISPTNFSVLQPSIPVFTMMLSVLFRMEKLTPIKTLGLLAAVAGAVVVEVVHSPIPGTGEKASQADFIAGNVIVILQCLSMASLLVFQKKALLFYHPTIVTAWYYSIGSILTLLICLSKSLPASAYALSSSLAPWLALAYAAIFGTAFNYNAYSWAGTVVVPAVISIYSTLQPLGTALLSFVFLGDKVTGGEAGGGVLVVLGLIGTVWGRERERERKAGKENEEKRGNEEEEVVQGRGAGEGEEGMEGMVAGGGGGRGGTASYGLTGRRDSKSQPLVQEQGGEIEERGRKGRVAI